jgi:ABC-type glycerol-3-phosphate transport system permease component
MKKKEDKFKIVISAFLWLLSATIILPLLYMLVSSSKTMYEYIVNPIGLPKSIIVDNYVAFFSGYNMLAYYRNSVIVSVSSALIALVVAVPAAFAISKSNYRWNRPVYLGVLSLMMVPGMVMLIPRYLMFSSYGLIDNLMGLILAYSAGAVPFTFYLLVANFKGIPNEMIEACKIDGATYFQTLTNVILPMGKPAIITVCILNFVSFWNETVQAILFINRDEVRTITSVVASMGSRFTANIPMIMTGLTLATIPTILVYVLFERHLEAGITMGSSK